MKKRISSIAVFWILFLVSLCGMPCETEARVTSEQQKEYVDALSQAMRDGISQKNMDSYKEVSQGSIGKKCMKQAALQNRIALMAEGIDFLDTNWTQYYDVSSVEQHTVFNSTKTVSRSVYQSRYQDIVKATEEVLSCVDASMTDVDKAMAVYIYLAKNTIYQASPDCHTGYDVLVNHTGVCDGFANAYALVLTTLNIPCAVVSNYTRDHSWNMIKLNGVWYLADLTNGIGEGNHEGMVVNYGSCLVGVSSFLKTHPGYKLSDLYGQGNSNGFDIRTMQLAQADYIPDGTAIKMGISAKTCLLYYNGYWYWISTGNMVKRSRLDGSGMTTVYSAPDDLCIGWLDQYNGMLLLSLNDVICKMYYDGSNLIQIHRVSSAEYHQEASSYFWQIAYVGRFIISERGRLWYYVSDLQEVRRGSSTISLGVQKNKLRSPVLSKKKITLQAGYETPLYVLGASASQIVNWKWRSSNSAVAEVDENGFVKAKKRGTAVISVALKNVRLRCIVRVTGYTITYKNVETNASGNWMTASGKKTMTLRSPKKEGYIFDGWYAERDYRRKVKSIPRGRSSNVILYAKWIPE